MLKYNLVYQCQNCNQVTRSEERNTKVFIDEGDISLYKEFVLVGSGLGKKHRREYVHECYTQRTNYKKVFGVMKFVGVECSVKA